MVSNRTFVSQKRKRLFGLMWRSPFVYICFIFVWSAHCLHSMLTNDHLISDISHAGMLKRLDMDHKDDSMSFVKDVAESTFSDGTTNWGRIATLIAFGAVLSTHLKGAGRPECVDAVADQISSYLAIQKYEWLINNNTWVSLCPWCHGDDC